VQQLRNQIEREGISFVKFREEIRDELTLQRLIESEVIARIEVTDSEVDNFLAAQAAAPQGQQEFNIAHILIRIPDSASAEQIAERRARADDVLRQLKSGADFAKLAASYSDAGDALKGGEIGWRGRDRLPQLFVDAVVPLRQNEFSGVMRSANGFHIVKLLGKRAPSVMASPAQAAPSVQQTRVRHILIKTNQVISPADARRKIEDIKKRIDAGASFEEMARQYSTDLSATKGGDLGWLYPGDTVPDFEQAMNSLQPGQVSGPVESPFGVHLIQVVERKTDDVSQDRQRALARQALRERKSDEAVQDWLRQLRDRTYVENRLEDR
jgi:peptidyl-prolyl cis-trans isomerase SurA